MSESNLKSVCEVQLTWLSGRIRVEVECFSYTALDLEESDAAEHTAAQRIDLGEFSEEELDRFYHALSQKVDGHCGEVTPAFIDELKSIIEDNL